MSLIYKINEKPKKIREWIGYVAQYVFAVLPATILISSICNTSIAAGLISAGIGTLVFLCVTGFKAPMVTSNSGATVSAIVGTIALGRTVDQQFTGVIIGGAIMALIYAIAALFVKQFGVKWLFKLMPPIISGTTIIVIGAVLSFFVPSYAQINGEYSLLGIGICFFTMIIAALVAHYAKGIWKTLPFLAALLIGDLLCIILTATGIAPLVDFAQFKFTSIISVPELAFLHIDFLHFDWSTLPQIILMYGLVSLAAMTEHIADVTTAGQVAETNLIENPGLHRTLLGDGLSSFAGALTGAQMTTTYSEYTGTMAVSKVASVKVTLATALTLIGLGFLTPFNQFLAALPNCVFAGVAICAYGMIANTGLKTILNSNIQFNNNKNIFIFACMMSCGISGLAINTGNFAIDGIVLAMIVGIILNLILKGEKE